MCGLLGLACAGTSGDGDALVLAVVVIAIVPVVVVVIVVVVPEDVLLDQGAGFEDCSHVSVMAMVKREVGIAGKGTYA